MISGPKNSGKSTFVVCLANSCFTNSFDIHVIDTDVGQPIFGIPGCVNLT